MVKVKEPPSQFVSQRSSRVVQAQSSVSHICSGSMSPLIRGRRGSTKPTPAMKVTKPEPESRRKGEGRIHPGSHPNQGKKGEGRKKTKKGSQGRGEGEAETRAGTEAEEAGVQTYIWGKFMFVLTYQ